MAEVAYAVLNAPTVTVTQITDVLKRDIPKAWNIPIYDDFPSERDRKSTV